MQRLERPTWLRDLRRSGVVDGLVRDLSRVARRPLRHVMEIASRETVQVRKTAGLRRYTRHSTHFDFEPISSSSLPKSTVSLIHIHFGGSNVDIDRSRPPAHLRMP